MQQLKNDDVVDNCVDEVARLRAFQLTSVGHLCCLETISELVKRQVRMFGCKQIITLFCFAIHSCI